jgi:class 3 adenylate cyclase/tetratricopeptide (TPR) repeat protein
VDIAAWLRELGLERYEPVFRDNEIDWEILPELTEADLEKLGIPLGPRKKLLKAIVALGAMPESAGHEGAPIPKPGAHPAERRQLTVLFCDLVGSTEYATRLDPEDMGALVHAYHVVSKDVVTRWDGHIAKYMGDGVLAYFGYPHAHEDDAERAVRAGLQLAAAIEALTTDADRALAGRIGIATGLVMVGELIGEGAAQEHTVVGETPSLAARLQALAHPGAVVVAASTRRLLGGLFELDDLGPQALKGFAEPVRAIRVVVESRTESRFEALHGRQLTPLVGREHELGLLLERFERAKGGEGQVVLLSGEPGIGKSRIVRALRERLEGEPYTPLSHYCSPFHGNSALHPVIGLLERAAGLARDDPPEVRLAKLEHLVTLSSDRLDAVVPLVAALLGVPTEEKYPPLELTPQRQRQRTLEVLVDQAEGLSRRQPVLALYEDVHWADPTTLELLGLVIERVQRVAVLVLITFRPEFTPPWAGHAHLTQLSLARLTRRHGGALIERVTGGKALPAEITARIVERTDGVPLFVEELTKSVLESGLLRDAGDRFELDGALPSLAIPSSLHDSLMARLDRLAPVKEVAQIGAVIGPEFSHELLAAVADRPAAELGAALERLVASELIFRRGTPPDATYSFKHALVQDVAYQSLLKSKRQRLHARVPEVLEQHFPETIKAHPELLAHHCEAAGLAKKAATYRYHAGQQAIARSAMAEAVAQLNAGLEALYTLPDGTERRGQELDLQVALGGALITAKGYAAQETGRAFARARELCSEQGSVPQLLPVMNGQVLFHSQRGEAHVAHRMAAEMLELAEAQGDPALLIPAHRALSLTSLHLGNFMAACRHAEQVIALYDPAQHGALTSLYAFDQRVVALGYLAAALLALGYPSRACRRSHEALAEARVLSHPNTLAQALHLACTFRLTARGAAGLDELAEALSAVAQEHGLAHFLAVGRVVNGRLSVSQGSERRFRGARTGGGCGFGNWDAGTAAVHECSARGGPRFGGPRSRGGEPGGRSVGLYGSGSCQLLVRGGGASAAR